MKRIIALIILVFYMASAIQFSVSFHYCGGSFKEICFTADTEKNCCGDKENDGCCTDKVVSAKFKDNHTLATSTVLSFTDGFAIIPALLHFSKGVRQICYPELIPLVSKGPSPPLLISSVPVFLFNLNIIV